MGVGWFSGQWQCGSSTNIICTSKNEDLLIVMLTVFMVDNWLSEWQCIRESFYMPHMTPSLYQRQ